MKTPTQKAVEYIVSNGMKDKSIKIWEHPKKTNDHRIYINNDRIDAAAFQFSVSDSFSRADRACFERSKIYYSIEKDTVEVFDPEHATKEKYARGYVYTVVEAVEQSLVPAPAPSASQDFLQAIVGPAAPAPQQEGPKVHL